MAIPAGFEPATHGVEIRFRPNNVNDLGAPCTIGVPIKAALSPISLRSRLTVALSGFFDLSYAIEGGIGGASTMTCCAY
jgi:hypothetical protein